MEWHGVRIGRGILGIAERRGSRALRVIFAVILSLIAGTACAEATGPNSTDRKPAVPSKRVALPDNVVPADANANAGTKNVLRMLYSLYAPREVSPLLVGQNIGHASAVTYNAGDPFDLYQSYIVDLEKQTGKRPAILALDYGWEEFDAHKISRANSLIVEHWSKGGLVTISMNPANPWTGVKGQRSLTTGTYDFADLFVKDSVPYRRLSADLDAIAKGLQELSDAGVTVLWRPYHEMNGGWAWWSFDGKGDAISLITPEHYKQLWDFSFDYLVKTKALHNLLFVYSPNATYGAQDAKSIAYYYPGSERVDVAAMDYYRDDMSQVNAGKDYDALVSLKKPIGFGEVGSAGRGPIDNLMLSRGATTDYPQMSFAVLWSGWSSLGGLVKTKKAIIENLNAKEFMNDPSMYTLTEVKHLREERK